MGKKLFYEEIVVPEVVNNKIEDSLRMVREGKIMSDDKMGTKKRKTAGKQIAATIAVALLLVTGGTVYAAVNHYLSKGMSTRMQIPVEEQQQLLDEGIAETYVDYDYSELKVTSGSVTVSPGSVITDGNFAYISFEIEGVEIEDGIMPSFENVDAYIDDGEEQEHLTILEYVYDGVIWGENGHPAYEDGSEIECDENGAYIFRYKNDEGKYEDILTLFKCEPYPYEEYALLGKTIHIEFENFGKEGGKCEYVNLVTGKWAFDITLPNVSCGKNIPVNKELEGTAFTVESIDLSKVSININLSVDRKNYKSVIINGKRVLGTPSFAGVVLKDGTRLTYLRSGGTYGYKNAEETEAYERVGFNQIIDPDEVEAILIEYIGFDEYFEIKL